MLARSRVLRVAATSSTSKDITKRLVCSSPAPAVAPAVVRSLYRSLYREVTRLDKNPVLKILFPCTKELQSLLGASGPLHVPGTKKYTEVLREVFRDAKRVPKIKLAFDTLNRLRAHHENVKSKLPTLDKERDRLLSSLRSPPVERRRKGYFRAKPLEPVSGAGPRYAQAAPGVPTRVVLRDARHNLELREGTILLAHPLSSAHVDRRAMLITECTPLLTSAVVLDLQFTYPLSRGNSMFPEVFWGHDVYDGGFSQIGFTMPPTAQISILHTLEPRDASAGRSLSMSSSISSAPSVRSWLRWKETVKSGDSHAHPPPGTASTSASSDIGSHEGIYPSSATSAMMQRHCRFCRPLIPGGVLDDGSREPTLYLSKPEALPYLAELAQGQPRSSLRVYWGNMRWTTSQLEAEVANGHWMAVTASPSFFRAYALSGPSDDAAECFPTSAQLAEAKQVREKRYGADITPPQVFPPDQIMRRRECLWDEIMYALGGEYAALVGCTNPFSDSPRWSPLQILSPHMTPLPLPAEEDVDAAACEAGVESAVSTRDVDLGEEETEGEGEGDDAPTDALVSTTGDLWEHSVADASVPPPATEKQTTTPPLAKPGEPSGKQKDGDDTR